MRTEAVTKEDQADDIIPPIQSVAPWMVKEVTPLSGFKLAVVFVDGTEGVVDMSARIASPKSGVFSTLRDQNIFAKAHVSYGAVTWPGDIDLAPDAMYGEIKAHGEWIIS